MDAITQHLTSENLKSIANSFASVGPEFVDSCNVSPEITAVLFDDVKYGKVFMLHKFGTTDVIFAHAKCSDAMIGFFCLLLDEGFNNFDHLDAETDIKMANDVMKRSVRGENRPIFAITNINNLDGLR